MKKLLGISLVAMMSVTAANAEIASKAYVDQQDGTLSQLTTTAKTNLVAAINELAAKAGSSSVADQIAAALEDYSTTEEANALYDEAGAATDAVNAITATGSNGVNASASNGAITVSGVAATTSAAGVVQLADSTAVENGTAGRVVDAAQLKAVADTASGALDDYYTKDEADAAFDEAGAADAVKAAISATGSNGVTASASDGAITVSGVAATTSAAGVVQLADAAAVTAGTAGRVVDAAQLKAVADTAGGNLTTALADYTPTANLDSSTTATTGQVVTAISMENGVLSQTTADPLTNASYQLQAAGGEAGKYALTAVYDGSLLTGYAWELIQRASGN